MPVAAAPTTASSAPEPGEPASAGQTVTVDRVTDGDTFVAKLRADDGNGRICSAPASSSSSSSGDDGGSINWPSPGDQGLPDGALTGGYCARKWWC